MRRKPIKNPSFSGCGTCGSTPLSILDERKKFYVGDVHYMSLRVDDRHITITGNGITLKDIEEQHIDKLDKCKFAQLYHDTPLHEETWELNTEDRKWYLVEQGEGYA